MIDSTPPVGRDLFLADLVVIFLTGAAGLAYQVAWQRYLARLLGGDALATAVILGVFLGGLSLGYILCGRLTRGVRNLLGAYALLEGFIGLWALAFPWLFSGIDGATSTWGFSAPWGVVWQGTLCAVLLIVPPTLCMGGTVPILTRALSRTLEGSTAVHARVYATNTAGAFLGALAAGFLLVPGLGLPGTVRLAALLNLAAAFYFLWRARRAAGPHTAPGHDDRETVPSDADREDGSPVQRQQGAAAEFATAPGPGRRAVLAIAFLSGIYVMTLESLFVRVTNLSLGSSSYSFTLIVAAFILCIAAGAWWVGRRRLLPPWSLLATQSGIGIILLVLFATLDAWPYGAHLLRIAFQDNLLGFTLYHFGALGLLCLLFILPVGLMGATLPLAFHICRRNVQEVGSVAGSIFGLNAAGNLVGGIVGGFVAYRWLGIEGVFLGALLLVGLSVMLAAGGSRRAGRLASVAVAISLVLVSIPIAASYRPQRFAAGIFRLRSAQLYSFDGPEAFFAQAHARSETIAYKDAPEGTFAVLETDNSRAEVRLPGFLRDRLKAAATEEVDPPVDAGRSRGIVVNGKPDSDTSADRETLKLCAHLPALLGRSRARVFVVGLGTGVTAGEFGLYPDVESIDVAEISATVAGFLPYFDEFTHGVRRDPRLVVHIGDAFRILRRSGERWDIIVSEPSNPWVTGVDQLYSREFYRLVKDHLSDGGVFLQWLQRYETSAEISAIAINTLRSEFPHVKVFRGSGGDDLYLASRQPIGDADFDRADTELRQNAALRESLQSIGIAGGEDLLAREQKNALAAAADLAHLGFETLDHPRIHYLSGYAFFTAEAVRRGRVVFSF